MLSTKNHLPGFSTLVSNSVIGGAKGGSLLITSDGAPANHTHYSALMGTSIVSQVEQYSRIRAAEIRVASHGLYFCLSSGREMERAPGNTRKHTVELVSKRTKTRSGERREGQRSKISATVKGAVKGVGSTHGSERTEINRTKGGTVAECVVKG